MGSGSYKEYNTHDGVPVVVNLVTGEVREIDKELDSTVEVADKELTHLITYLFYLESKRDRFTGTFLKVLDTNKRKMKYTALIDNCIEAIATKVQSLH